MSRPSFPFDVRSRDVWRIALPASFAFITEPLAGLNDIAVVGRLGDANLLGGLVLGALLFDCIFSLAYFLRLGTAGLTAQSVGARDPFHGLMHVTRAVLMGAVIGVVMIALATPLLWLAGLAFAPSAGVAEALGQYFYVRIWSAPFSLVNYALLGWFYGRADVKKGVMLQMLVHGVDIALSILFVYGFGWGIFGAALGTVLGQVAAAFAGLWLLVRHYGGIRNILAHVVPKDLFDAVAIRRMLGLSRDLMIRSAALMAAYAWFAAQGSRGGEVTLSANAILLNFMMVSGFFLDGLAQASEQLCGKAVGANWRPAFERSVSLSMRLGLAISGGLAVVWLVGGPLAIDFMTTNDDVRFMAREFLLIAALASLTGMPAFVMDGVLTGATLNTIMRNGMVLAFGIYLAVALTLQPLWGNNGLWVALHTFFIARGAIYWFAMQRRKPALFAVAA